MSEHQDHSSSTIESAIRATGARVTPCRVRVLSVLQAEHAPLSHSDIEARLSSNATPEMDRVTLYRILDWLVEAGLAHKAPNTRGVFCFTSANPDIEHHRHMHFRCNDCGKFICLDLPVPVLPALPNGFLVTGVELDVSGECPDCVRQHQTQVAYAGQSI